MTTGAATAGAPNEGATNRTTLGAAERAVLLAFADDEHLMGQRHTEWIGVAPFLEEDMAFASIGQDELGHAAMLYERVLTDGPASDHDVDVLALRRGGSDYRSCWLAEAPCTEWAAALVRHWMYDAAESLRWNELAGSTDERLRGIAARALSEERYHLRHADALLDALAGDPDADSRIAAAVDDLLPLAMALFDAPDDGAGADPLIVGRPLPDLQPAWRAAMVLRFGPLDWAGATPADQRGRTARSAAFDAVYGAMREVIMLDPDAAW